LLPKKQLTKTETGVFSTASGQASEAGPAVRKAHREKPPDRPKNKRVCFSAGLRFFFCPEALLATLKFQAQIVCSCIQADSPAGFFAAFFPGKKARILPSPISVYVFSC